MKYILHIAAALRIGGAEKVTRDIGMFADSAEYENHYVVFGNEVGAYEQQLMEHGCKIYHIDSPGENYKVFVNTLKKIMQTYSYSVVHCHTMFNAGWVMYVAKKMQVPVRVAHAHSALDTSGGLKVRIYEKVMQYLILTHATDLIACGKKAGIRLFGEKEYAKRAHLVLNGIDTKAFSYSEENRKKIREQRKLSDNFVIGHAGHLAEVKNQKYLIELMPNILEKRPEARLLLLGEGEDRSMLENKIADLNLQDKVFMTGNVMNVAEYLSAMDVFAFPSLYEGMPLSIIEVQANGLPCVLSTGVPKDVYLTDLIHPASLEEPDKWIDMICSLERNDVDKYDGLLEEEGFDVTSMVKKVYDIYERRL